MRPWYEVYAELAQLLSKFLTKHPGDAGLELYQQCVSHKWFLEDHRWIRERLFQKSGLDPIHVFASFNEHKLPAERRIKKVLAWYRIFSVKPNFKEIDFSGCPSPITIRILSARKHKQQKEIWGIFKKVSEEKQKALNGEVFEMARKWFGIDIPSFTMFLFWINPQNFLPLDKNTMRLLNLAQLAKSRLEGFDEYKWLIKFKETTKYIEISRNAVELLEDSKAMSSYARQLNLLYYTPGAKRQRSTDNDFRIIGLKLLSGTLEKHSRVLDIGKPYSFYSQFEILKDGSVKLSSLNDFRLYSHGDLNINVSAVVGKNGSGKSTIAELFYATVYNIACRFSDEFEGSEPVKGLNIELYYLSSNLYKLVLRNGNVKVYRYDKNDTGYFNPKLLKKDEFKLDDFFYTIAINYSHYGLNERYIGRWINELFHKNDGYQVPITLAPFRKDGNIDINSENELVISRVVANVLEPVSSEGSDNIRKITEDGRLAAQIKFSLNEEKIKDIKVQKGVWNERTNHMVIAEVYSFFGIKTRRNKDKLKWITEDYIYKKLLKIPQQYPWLYGEFALNTSGKMPDKELVKRYLITIWDDPSHVAYKFKQAINFLKHDSLFNIRLNVFNSVEKLSKKIENVKKDIESSDELKTIEFIPPSFLKAEIRLSDGTGFNDLSSGEKQRIYAASSLVYHLNNLSSVVNPSIVCYSNVNVIFDEIELYFHPDMQRTFLTYLLVYLNRVGFQNIYGLNFCFITHSPFILSDIPSENILFLKKKEDKYEKVNLKTFGANIHELLMDGFFMDQTLGEFALSQVQEIIYFHEKISKNTDPTKEEEFEKEYSGKRNRFYFVRDSLGEAYISNIVKSHILEIEEILEDESFIDLQIKKLEGEISSLKKKRNA